MQGECDADSFILFMTRYQSIMMMKTTDDERYEMHSMIDDTTRQNFLGVIFCSICSAFCILKRNGA